MLHSDPQNVCLQARDVAWCVYTCPFEGSVVVYILVCGQTVSAEILKQFQPSLAVNNDLDGGIGQT